MNFDQGLKALRMIFQLTEYDFIWMKRFRRVVENTQDENFEIC